MLITALAFTKEFLTPVENRSRDSKHYMESKKDQVAFVSVIGKNRPAEELFSRSYRSRPLALALPNNLRLVIKVALRNYSLEDANALQTQCSVASLTSVAGMTRYVRASQS